MKILLINDPITFNMVTFFPLNSGWICASAELSLFVKLIEVKVPERKSYNFFVHMIFISRMRLQIHFLFFVTFKKKAKYKKKKKKKWKKIRTHIKEIWLFSANKLCANMYKLLKGSKQQQSIRTTIGNWIMGFN